MTRTSADGRQSTRDNRNCAPRIRAPLAKASASPGSPTSAAGACPERNKGRLVGGGQARKKADFRIGVAQSNAQAPSGAKEDSPAFQRSVGVTKGRAKLAE